MNEIRYYHAGRGSTNRVTITLATTIKPKTCKQARKSTFLKIFSPKYDIEPAEAARLVAVGSFIEIPAL